MMRLNRMRWLEGLEDGREARGYGVSPDTKRHLAWFLKHGLLAEELCPPAVVRRITAKGRQALAAARKDYARHGRRPTRPPPQMMGRRRARRAAYAQGAAKRWVKLQLEAIRLDAAMERVNAAMAARVALAPKDAPCCVFCWLKAEDARYRWLREKSDRQEAYRWVLTQKIRQAAGEEGHAAS